MRLLSQFLWRFLNPDHFFIPLSEAITDFWTCDTPACGLAVSIPTDCVTDPSPNNFQRQKQIDSGTTYME